MIKNTFYFTLKPLFFLKIFKFLSWLFGHAEKRLDYKDKVRFKIYDGTAYEKPFFWKIIHKMWWRKIPDPFLKYKNWAYLWINSLMFYTVCFHCISSWGLSKNIEPKVMNTYIYIYKTFLKNKMRFGTNPASFSTWLLKINVSLVIFY